MSELDELKEALTSVQVGIWWWDIASDEVRWSDELYALFGRDRAGPPMTFGDYLGLLPPEERDGLQATVQHAMQQATQTRANTSYLVEHRANLAGGKVRWIEGRGHVLVDGHGKPARLTGTAVDITERKHTEERLRQSEQTHRLFSELASDYVYVVDYLNPTLFPEIVGGSFERTTGLTPAAVKAMGGWWQVIHPGDRAALEALVPQLQQGKPSINEYRITDGAGQTRWLRDSIRPLTDPATGKVVKLMGGVQDITERKRLEEQLLQAQKLEAVARLSGGIAHDFNNLLSVIMGSVSMLQLEVKTPNAVQSCDAIMEAANRGAELTRSLLMFARRDVGTPKLVNLAEVVREALPMLTRAVGPTISVSVGEQPGPCPVRIDRGQAQLLLLNLAVNARDAMPKGGTIRLTLSAGVFGPGDGLPSELKPGPWVRLAIEDDGEGIAPEVMPRLFEPFFTTKQQGKGTGLGLAACHGIVQHAGGAIAVTSAIARGTTFTIFLPLAEGASVSAESSRARTSPGGTERLLLVEDEPQLQRLLLRGLSELGYAVQAVSSAEDALGVLEAGPVALLISDIVLGGMRGTELVVQVRSRWPGTRCLLMSGYSGDTAVPAGVTLLNKPFTLDRLATRVREVLDGPGHQG